MSILKRPGPGGGVIFLLYPVVVLKEIVIYRLMKIKQQLIENEKDIFLLYPVVEIKELEMYRPIKND